VSDHGRKAKVYFLINTSVKKFFTGRVIERVLKRSIKKYVCIDYYPVILRKIRKSIQKYHYQ